MENYELLYSDLMAQYELCNQELNDLEKELKDNIYLYNTAKLITYREFLDKTIEINEKMKEVENTQRAYNYLGVNMFSGEYEPF